MTAASNTPDWGLDAFTSFWTEAGRAAVQAQETAGRAFADALKAMPGIGGAAPAFPFTPHPFPGAMPDQADLRRATQAVAELWAATAGLSATIAAAGGHGDAAIDGAFRAMTDPKAWLASLGGLDTMTGTGTAEGAEAADPFQAERQQARMMQAWMELRRRELEHQAVVLGAWMEAGQAFTRAVRQRQEQGAPPLDGRALLTLWTDTANEVLLTFQRSDRFMASQAAALRAASAFRLAQRSLAERWSAQFDLPTRTEFDELHRTVAELRRELRALRPEPPTPAPTPAPAPVKPRKQRARTT